MERNRFKSNDGKSGMLEIRERRCSVREQSAREERVGLMRLLRFCTLYITHTHALYLPLSLTTSLPLSHSVPLSLTRSHSLSHSHTLTQSHSLSHSHTLTLTLTFSQMFIYTHTYSNTLICRMLSSSISQCDICEIYRNAPSSNFL